MNYLVNRLSTVRSERGATALEYALLASLIAAVIVGTVATLGEKVVALFSSVGF